MRYSFAVAAALLGASAPADAANDQVLRGPVPEWVTPAELLPVPQDASGLMFVRRQDSLVHLDDKGQSLHFGFRAKILHQNALELGNLTFTWSPSAGQPTVHRIVIHRDGQAIDVLERASFEILRREDQLEQASLDGLLTAVLRVSDLRVGDELDVAVTTRAADPTLGPTDAGLLALSPEPSPGRYRLGISWEPGQEPRLQWTPDLKSSVVRGARSLTATLDDPPIVAPPKDAPQRYRWMRIIEYSDFPDWQAVSRTFFPLFRKAAAIGPASPLKQEAERIARAHPTALGRASAALKLVQQQVRYVYVGLDGGNLTPAGAEETWKRRYGDCKGKTALLLALLGELGIPAEAVLVNNSGLDDGLDTRLASSKMFDHVLVRARIDGADYWMDGTLPAGAAPSVRPVMPYRWVLPLAEAGRTIERLALAAPARPTELTLFDIDARAGFDQPATITSTRIVRGVEALQEQVQFSAVTPAQLLATFSQQAVGETWQTIDDVRWHYDAKAEASVLRITGKGKIDWEDDGGGARSLSLPGGGFNPPDKRVRPAEQGADVPFYSAFKYDCWVTTVRLPAATKPSRWSHNANLHDRLFGRTYYRAFELRDATIRMVRGSRVEQEEIDAATARRDNGRIAAFNNSMGVIHYDPDEPGPMTRAAVRVPATDEIDWTADTVPCLPSAAAK